MENRRRNSISMSGVPTGTGDSIFRTLSRTFSGKSHHEDKQRYEENESGDSDSAKTRVAEWRLAAQVKNFQLNDQPDSRKLGVTWRNLIVKVVPSDTRLQENVLSQFNIPQQVKESRQKLQLSTILDASHGNVRPGEMLLVLGKPGSGCTTLLKVLANKRKGYVQAEVNDKNRARG
jgi:ATPase subunit of ABC transporter with duplicated ATPase domains